jgi:DNA-binding CsgD family transcriptional regulator
VGVAVMWKWVFHHEHGLLKTVLDPLLPFGLRSPAWFETDAETWGVPAFVITGLAMKSDWVLRLAALGVARNDKPVVDGLVVVLAERAIATRAEQQNKLFAALDSLKLTDAESDVVLALARGENVAGIAASGGKSERTIENQIASVCAKLLVHSQVAIVSRVVDAILALG